MTGTKAYFSIGEAAESLGASASTLRRWEREGRLPFTPHRSPTGRRMFTQDNLRELRELLRGLHPEAHFCADARANRGGEG